jgi:copper(I)-binding protein
MYKSSRYSMLALISLLAGLAQAQSPGQSAIQVKEPWVRGTVAQQKATGAFMQLSAPQDMRLIEARSPVAGVVELHEMAMDNNVMKMRAVPGIDIPAGKGAELKPGGFHVMLLDLKKQLKEGDTVPLTLVLEGKDKKRQSIEVNAPVRALGTRNSPGKAANAEHNHPHGDHGSMKH